jgi:hypothetical protein
VVIVLAIRPKVPSSNLVEDDGLRLIKLRATPSFRRDVKPSAPC